MISFSIRNKSLIKSQGINITKMTEDKKGNVLRYRRNNRI